MLDILSSTKTIEDQTSAEKLYILKMLAQQILGAKWVYYRKIKHAGEGFKLFREKSLMEQMKATQAALKFTSKHTKKFYRNTYKNTLNDIKRFSAFKTEDFPELPEGPMGEDPPSLESEHDEVIIAWTPIKFLLPVKTIREKGIATQPHSEGLVAKLFFKLAGFYAAVENWDKEKLTLYLRKLDQNSSYSEVTNTLNPLKDDLLKFSELYIPFKFGKGSTSKDKTSDANAFDEDLGEGFEDQLRTLYWYHFIYWGMELFLIRYYLTLVSSTSSTLAIRTLSQIFKPAIFKAIENHIIFETSLETEASKKTFRRPYQEYRRKRQNEPPKRKVKTKNGIFVTYPYNLTMLEKREFGTEINAKLKEDSEWGEFVDFDLLDAHSFQLEKGNLKSDPVPHDVIEYAIMHILNLLVSCTQYKRKARHKTLDLFKERVEADTELTRKRIEEMRRQGDKYIRGLERKVTKLRRMKQNDSAEIYRKDIESYRKRLEDKSASIIEMAQQETSIQKRRIQTMFQEISQEKDVSEGISAKYLLDLIETVSPRREFLREFIKHTAERIQKEYEPDLESFYQHLFYILEPSIQEKVILIQSLEKTGESGAVKLSLTDEEREENQKIISLLKMKIKKTMPDIFNCRVVFITTLIPIDDLFKLSLNNQSLQTLLKLKVTSTKSTKPIMLKENIIKVLMVLNLVSNPVPKNNIVQADREHMKDPQQMINTQLLTQLLDEIKVEQE
ncbi:MAG: hypothetical protein HQ517_11885 [SAR324 cluster bacterium]|nr:hypothetical protein [SAR324 cluster bacterium]